MKTMSQNNFNAVIGILGIFILGIFLDWFPKAFLQIQLPANPLAHIALNNIWQFTWQSKHPARWP